MQKILGIRIDNLNKKEILEKVNLFLKENKFHQIATVNPEFILQAQNDIEFRNILNDCDLNVADGIGIWFAFLRFGKIIKTRLAGIDLMAEILKIADAKKLKIFLVSYAGALSSWEDVRDIVSIKYPNLRISGITLEERLSIKELVFDAEIVFCNFGAPYQEKFLHSLKNSKNANINLVMGVGGSFDFLTGKCKRAPKLAQRIGLEWLWRFMQDPRYRAKRIFRAVIIFPIKILFKKNDWLEN